MAVITKQLPNGQTVTLPDIEERPNANVLIIDIGYLADNMIALGEQMQTVLNALAQMQEYLTEHSLPGTEVVTTIVLGTSALGNSTLA